MVTSAAFCANTLLMLSMSQERKRKIYRCHGHGLFSVRFMAYFNPTRGPHRSLPGMRLPRFARYKDLIRLGIIMIKPADWSLGAPHGLPDRPPSTQVHGPMAHGYNPSGYMLRVVSPVDLVMCWAGLVTHLVPTTK